MTHRLILLSIFMIASSAQAISFRDYYQLQEKTILASLSEARLDLSGKHLTSLDGFNLTDSPELAALQTLNLNDNDLTHIPSPFIFPNLSRIYLINNPIPGTTDQLRETLGLPKHTTLFFKSTAQELFEEQLTKAVSSLDVGAEQHLLKELTKGMITAPFITPIQLAKIRDAHGNTLLHLLATSAGNCIKIMRNVEELSEIWSLVTDNSLQVLFALNGADQNAVREMLITRNPQGQIPAEIILDLAGPGPLYKAFIKLARTYTNTEPIPEESVATMADVEEEMEK